MNNKDNKLIFEAYTRESDTSDLYSTLQTLISPDLPTTPDELKRALEAHGLNTNYPFAPTIEWDGAFYNEELAPEIIEWVLKSPSYERAEDYIDSLEADIGKFIENKKELIGTLQQIKFGKNLATAQKLYNQHERSQNTRPQSPESDKRNQEPGKVYTHTPKMNEDGLSDSEKVAMDNDIRLGDADEKAENRFQQDVDKETSNVPHLPWADVDLRRMPPQALLKWINKAFPLFMNSHYDPEDYDEVRARLYSAAEILQTPNGKPWHNPPGKY